MQIELKQLFNLYNIQINIDDCIANKINCKENNLNQIKFGVNDFEQELIELINQVYEKDFFLFGYNMI